MRISTSQIHQVALKSILDQQAQLVRTQQEISTGKRILTPADDPSGTAAIIGYEQSLALATQYQKNITAGRQRLNGEESTLSSVTNILDRVRELAVQSGNSTLSGADRRAIAVEMRQHLEEIVNLANTTDANGEYIFAGYQGRTQPFARDSSGSYVYNGDGGQRFLQVGATQQVPIGDPGATVFMQIRPGNGTFAVRGDAANAGNGVLDPGSVTDPSAYDADNYTISFPHATAASGTLAFNDSVGTNDNLTYSLSINGTVVYSVAESGTPVASVTALAAEINDDSATTGVRAVVDAGTLYLVSTAPGQDPIQVTETLSGASDGDSDTVTGYFGSALTGSSGPSATINYAAADASRYIVEDSAGNIEASGDYVNGVQIAFNGIQTSLSGTPRTGDRFTVAPSGNQDLFGMIEDIALTLEGGTTGTNPQGTLSNALSGFLADIDQAMENIRSVRAHVGARLTTLDTQDGMNQASILQMQEARSNLEDLDYASAITRLSQQTTGLEAAQKSYLQIQGLSLFKYL